MDTPVKDMLQAYSKSDAHRFHMPGHKGAYKVDGSHDITELDFSDDLYGASGVLMELEATLAQRAKSKRSLVLTGGSSAGVRIILTVLKQYCGNKKILIANNAHRSVADGCIIAGIDPIILPLEELINCIDSSVGAIFITSPDYYGNMADIIRLREACDRFGVILAQDEAHGAHLPYIGLPSGAEYADISVQSMHKTMGALTQAATLNINRDELIRPALLARRMLCTSSPSYLVMESMEWASNQYVTEAPAFLKRVTDLRAELEKLNPDASTADPTRLYLRFPLCSGFEAARLFKQKGVIPEMADEGGVVFILTPHDKDYSRLIDAAKQICKLNIPRKKMPAPPALGNFAVSMRDAALSKHKYVDILNAEGCISGACIGVYPPGIPQIYPGQIITKEHIRFLTICAEQAEIFGLVDGLAAVVK